MQRKNSEIVRLALRQFLGASSGSAMRPADRARSLIGSLESGVPDLAEEHRARIIGASGVAGELILAWRRRAALVAV